MNIKKIILSICLLFCFYNKSFSQYSRLGFRNDVNLGFYLMNYDYDAYHLTTNSFYNDAHVDYKNINIRFGGSLLGLLFKEESKFFIGDYYQVSVGVGSGNKSGSLGSQYNGKAANLLMGFNFGLVSTYSFSEDLTIGLKVIGAGGDLYMDLDRQPKYMNGLTFHPTTQYKGFLFSIGYGGRNPYKTFDTEFRYNFSKSREKGMYLGCRYQKNWAKYTDDTYKYSQTISSTGLLFGYTF
jgi:hypothetical protein